MYEKSISTKMNDLDLCLEVVSRSRPPLRYIFNISETVRDSDINLTLQFNVYHIFHFFHFLSACGMPMSRQITRLQTYNKAFCIT